MKSWIQTLIATVICVAFGFASNIATARVLGPDGRGVFSSLLLIATLSATVGQLGLSQTALYRVKNFGTSRTLRMALWLLLAVSVVTLIVSVGSYSFYAHYAETEFSAGIVVPLAVVMAGYMFCAQFSQVRSDLITFNTTRAALSLLLFVSILVAHTLIDDGSEIEVLLTNYSLSYILMTAVIIVSLYRRPFDGNGIGKYSEFGRWAFWKFAGKTHSTTALGLVVNNVDKIYIMAVTPGAEFGLYSVCYTVSRLISLFQDTIAVNLYSKGLGQPKDQVAIRVVKGFKLGFFASALVGGALCLCAEEFLRVAFGESYAGAANILSILVVEAVLGSGSWVLAQYFIVVGRPGIVLLRQVVSVLPVVALLPFIPMHSAAESVAKLLMLGAVLRLGITLMAFKYTSGIGLQCFLPKSEDFVYLAQMLSKKFHRT